MRLSRPGQLATLPTASRPSVVVTQKEVDTQLTSGSGYPSRPGPDAAALACTDPTPLTEQLPIFVHIA